MTKLQIRKLARQKAKEGKSRQQIYNEIVKETGEWNERVAKIVRYVPSQNMRDKYRTVNNILAAVMCLMGIAPLIVLVDLYLQYGRPEILAIGIILPGIFIWSAVRIYMFHTNQYTATIGIFVLFILRARDWHLEQEAFLIGLAVALFQLGLGLYLFFKVASNYKVVETTKLVDGVEKKGKFIEFPDDEAAQGESDILDL